MGDGSHKSPSILPANPFPVRVSQPHLGANYHDNGYAVHGYDVLHARRVGHAPVQHTRWDRSGYSSHRSRPGILTGGRLFGAQLMEDVDISRSTCALIHNVRRNLGALDLRYPVLNGLRAFGRI